MGLKRRARPSRRGVGNLADAFDDASWPIWAVLGAAGEEVEEGGLAAAASPMRATSMVGSGYLVGAGFARGGGAGLKPAPTSWRVLPGGRGSGWGDVWVEGEGGSRTAPTGDSCCQQEFRVSRVMISAFAGTRVGRKSGAPRSRGNGMVWTVYCDCVAKTKGFVSGGSGVGENCS